MKPSHTTNKSYKAESTAGQRLAKVKSINHNNCQNRSNVVRWSNYKICHLQPISSLEYRNGRNWFPNKWLNTKLTGIVLILVAASCYQNTLYGTTRRIQFAQEADDQLLLLQWTLLSIAELHQEQKVFNSQQLRTSDRRL